MRFVTLMLSLLLFNFFYSSIFKGLDVSAFFFNFSHILPSQSRKPSCLPLVCNRQQLGMEHPINTVRATTATDQSGGSSTKSSI